MTLGPLGYVATLPRDKVCFCNVKQKKGIALLGGESNPGLPRDKQGYLFIMLTRISDEYFFHGNKLCACMVASCVPHAYHGPLVIKYKSYLTKYSTDVRFIPDPFFYIPDHSPKFNPTKARIYPDYNTNPNPNLLL